MKYCIAGKNEIAIFGVELLLKSGISRDKIVACCNSNDTGINGWQPSFRNYCIRNNILVLHLEEIYNLVALVFISLEFDKIIKISKFRSRALFNIHFSLLPEYKGMYTSAMPILEGREYSGVTLHKLDEGIDTGDIIDQLDLS